MEIFKLMQNNTFVFNITVTGQTTWYEKWTVASIFAICLPKQRSKFSVMTT